MIEFLSLPFLRKAQSMMETFYKRKWSRKDVGIRLNGNIEIFNQTHFQWNNFLNSWGDLEWTILHLWNWNLKSHIRWWFVECQTTFQNQNSNGWKTHFWTNFGHHCEFQMKKPKKLHSLSIFANGNRIHNYKREIMKDEWRWFNLLWKTKFFWFFFFRTFCCQFENSFLFELCFFFQPATFNSKWITIQNDKTSLISIEFTFSK